MELGYTGSGTLRGRPSGARAARGQASPRLCTVAEGFLVRVHSRRGDVDADGQEGPACGFSLSAPQHSPSPTTSPSSCSRSSPTPPRQRGGRDRLGSGPGGAPPSGKRGAVSWDAPPPRAPALLWATEPGPARGPSLPVPISIPVQYGITRLHVRDTPPSLVVPLAVCPTTAHMAWQGQLPVCSQNANVHPGDVLV